MSREFWSKQRVFKIMYMEKIEAYTETSTAKTRFRALIQCHFRNEIAK